MRRTVLALALLAAIPACSLFRKGKLTDSTPAHTPAQASSPFGEWVLFTDPDSTAFVGARRVELRLTPSDFRMVAAYPAGDQVVITGAATVTPAGLLTLLPQSVTAMASGSRPPILAGQMIQVLASAADNTMVFAPPSEIAPTPSSVWHRIDKAREAGQVPVPARTAGADSL
ncbi:MAG: hypothetical protein ACT4PJ_07185 [Gemmatimonadaceae bacterium]